MNRQAMGQNHWAKIILGLYALFLLYWAFRLKGQLPATMDTLEYVFPEKWVNVEQWGRGVIPLWNPYIGCGTPHLASFQPASFYPPFWAWNLTGLFDWFLWIPLLHCFWGALGFYAWARTQQSPPIMCALGGLAFMGTAQACQLWGFPSHLSTLSWVPWIFASAQGVLDDPSPKRRFFLGASLALQILAGYAYFTLYTWLFLGAWLLWKRPRRGQWMDLALPLVGALLLTAVQWLPFLDYNSHAQRDPDRGGPFQIGWKELLWLLVPRPFGTPGMEGYGGNYANFIFSVHLGLVSLGLWVLSLFKGERGSRFWIWAGLFFLFWPLGRHFLLGYLLPKPILDALEPSKGSFLFAFCAITWICLGGIRWFGGKAFPRWAVALSFLWALELALMPFRVVQPVPDPYRDPEVGQAASHIKTMAAGGRLLSLRGVNGYYPPGEGSPALSFKKSAQWMIQNTNAVWGARSVDGYLSTWVDGLQNIRKYLALGIRNDRFLDVAGAGLFVLPENIKGPKFTTWRTLGDSVLIKNAGAQGTAWCPSTVREFENRPRLLEELLQAGAFIEDEVFTEKAGDGKAVRLPAAGRFLGGSPGESPGPWRRFEAALERLVARKNLIAGERPSPCRQEFEVNSTQPGFLVFGEACSPGWKAWVDGEPKPIFRAYGFFMAVLVKGEGLHRIHFRYEPPAFRLGLFLSLFALAAVAGWLGARFLAVPAPK